MRSIISTLVSVAFLVSGAAAQRLVTSTLPYADGNTVVVSIGTNALGLPVTSTVSTIGYGGGAAITTPTTALTTTTNTRLRTTTAATTTATTQRVVGQEPDTNGPPMRTTTYGYAPAEGGWTSGTWTASVTADPTVATAIIPAGTIQDYNSYQTVINSAVYASAQAADNAANTGSVRTSGAASQKGRADVWGGMAVAGAALLVGANLVL